jgi:hypothetical protein
MIIAEEANISEYPPYPSEPSLSNIWVFAGSRFDFHKIFFHPPEADFMDMD